MAKQLIDIVSGEIEDTLSANKKQPSRRRTAEGRAVKSQEPDARGIRDIAVTAARARWKKKT
jgi:hypothetical protein